MTPTPRTDAYLADLRARWAKSRRGRQPDTTSHRAGERTVPGYVRHWARQTPDRPAFITHGRTLTAFVRTAPGSALTADELRAWAKEAMATYKVPLVEIVPELPLTPTGKIRKTELSARASRTRPAP